MITPSSLVPQRGSRSRILVAGAGIAGISATIEAAEAGAEVALVERAPHLGGRVAQMHQYFPKLCPPACGLQLNLRRLADHPRITTFTLTEVETIEGGPGRYRVTLRERPRFVTDRCTACGSCAAVCPAERVSDFDFGLASTRAVHLSHATAWPVRYVLDRDACLPGCSRCVTVCPMSAIDLTMRERRYEIAVDAIIWSTGWDPYDARQLGDLGFGVHPDVITGMMLERLAAPHGPTRGRILRPSNGEVPKRVAFVQCAGSRDDAHLPYCSALCCLASAKHVRYLRAQHPATEVFVHYIDLRAAGRLEPFLADTQKDPQVHFVRGKVATVAAGERGPVVFAEDVNGGHRIEATMDLVVLATGIVPAVAATFPDGLGRDEQGFFPREHASAGHLSAGCARGPMDVAASVRDATSAALRALALGARRSEAAGGTHG